MCDFCDHESSKIFDASQNAIVVLTRTVAGDPLMIIVQQTIGAEAQSVTIAISNCPWCGKKL